MLDFPVVTIETDRAMWLYSRHDETVRHWELSTETPVDTAPEAELGAQFGINTEKVRQWRSTSGSVSGIHGHSGKSAAVQYDRLFQIAILNRKINALKKRDGIDDRTLAGATDEIERCAAERGLVIAALRQN